MTRCDRDVATSVSEVPAWMHGIDASRLMQTEFPPLRYVIQDLITEGLTIFAGAPKVGKSWWALNAAVAVAGNASAFESLQVEEGDVLYLALEDNPRRLQSRLGIMGLADAPKRLRLCTKWPTLGTGALKEIKNWIEAVEKPTLVIVDVLAHIRDHAGGSERSYERDYSTISGLQKLASELRVAIVAIHHTRKLEAEDPFDSVSGTRGLTGSADTVLVLKRDNRDRRTVLYGRGRDIPEIETAFEFSADIGTWKVLGNAKELGRTKEREAILSVLRAAAKPITAQDVSLALGGELATVRRTLNRMAADGEIEKPGRGLYCCLNCPNV